MGIIQRDLTDINRRVCHSIWDMIGVEDNPTGVYPRLIVPNNNDEPRISEQEARFIYTAILQNTNYYYSVETPTIGKYSFTGGGSMTTARTDISLYLENINQNRLIHRVNVELKANNPESEMIYKDVEKLVNEQKLVFKQKTENEQELIRDKKLILDQEFIYELEGNWFHLFKKVDSATIEGLFEKIRKSFHDYNNNYGPIDYPVSILFTLCVKDQKWACSKHFDWNLTEDFMLYVNDFFQIDYEVNKEVIIDKNLNKWIKL